MDLLKRKAFSFKPLKSHTKKIKIIFLLIAILVLREIPQFHVLKWNQQSCLLELQQNVIRKDKFLHVPPIIYGGLNNQKIALARALLTAKFLNRTLLLPILSPLLIFNEVDIVETIEFDKIFDFDKFNLLCDGFARLARYSELLNKTEQFKLRKGRGKMWTKERDLNQLNKFKNDTKLNDFEVIRVTGKQAFLWHDHWPAKDYAKIFECLVLVREIENDVAKVISKIKEIGIKARNDSISYSNSDSDSDSSHAAPYMVVHMRVERDWMVHCKNWEQRDNMTQICSGKSEIMEKVSQITDLNRPVVVYLAVADNLLGDNSILNGWKPGLLPCEKKGLGVWDIYKKYPYIIQSAIDFEVCVRADVFVGNSFSTFSGLVVLTRTNRLFKLGITSLCGSVDGRFSSYAYNVFGDNVGAPKRWMTDMSAVSLRSISYGSTNISCDGINSNN